MAEINKPDYSQIWASGGAIVAPSDVKIQTGWTAEVPPFQWENWSQNRQDQGLAHLFQKGISVWSATGEYYFTTSGERSYVQGSDGSIYVAVADSVNQNPVTDLSNTYWRKAFAEAGDVPVVSTAAQSRAQTDNTVFLSPLQLANAFTGTNQNTASNGFQYLPGGVVMNWGQGDAGGTTSASVTFTKAFNTRVFVVLAIDAGSSNRTISNTARTLTGASFQFSGTANSFYWLSIGI